MAYITKTKIGSNTYPIGSCLYGTCSTATGTAAKVVTMADFDTLVHGVTIHVKFTNYNSASSPTLNVNSTGAKKIYMYGGNTPGTTVATSWQSGQVVSFTYDSGADSNAGAWFMNDSLNTDTNTNTNPYPFVYISTGAGTVAKVGTCSGYVINTNSYFIALITTTNSAANPTLNINGKGAKPIYLNGISPTASTTPAASALVAGTYLVYYDGTNYYFRTDGEITCPDDITATEIANDIFNSAMDPIDVDNITQEEIDDLFVWIE